VAVLAPSALAVLRAGADTPQRRRIALCVAAYAVWLGLQTLFRLLYYGAWLPNTFYAKAGSGSLDFGLLYLQTYLRAGAGWLLLPALLAAIWEPRWRPGLGFVAAWFLYVVLVGGDAFGQRFVLPTLPVLAALAVGGSVLAWRRGGPMRAVVLCLPAAAGCFLFRELPLSLALLLTAVAGLLWAGSRWRRPLPLAAGALAALAGLALWPADGGGSQLSDLACRLAAPARNERLANVRDKDRRFERGALRTLRVIRERGGEPLVAAGAIGALGYHADFAVLDLFGLTDATIARSRPPDAETHRGWPGHSRSDADYVMARSPDYVLIPRGRIRGRLPAIRDLLQHPEFQRRYEWDAKLRGYRRRDGASANALPTGRGDRPGADRLE
jgi:hypothetical protein